MTVEDRLISLIANFAHGDENALGLYDPIWSGDGGPLEPEQAPEFLDELEGEFGIKVRDREVENISSLHDLLQLVQTHVSDDNP